MSRALPPHIPPADVELMFGTPDDGMQVIERRAHTLFPDQPVIVWEGDPATFRFSFVSQAAERVLGYPSARWIEEPTFWTDHLVHPDDRSDAVAYCALATCKRADHVFEYRARSSRNEVVWLLDIVRVVLGPKQLPVALRGAMFDITRAKQQASAGGAVSHARSPTFEELHAMQAQL